jgi:hypothetical protein
MDSSHHTVQCQSTQLHEIDRSRLMDEGLETIIFAAALFVWKKSSPTPGSRFKVAHERTINSCGPVYFDRC